MVGGSDSVGVGEKQWELVQGEGLGAVAHGFGGVVVAFDHDAVGTGGDSGAGEGGDELAVAGGVGGVDDDAALVGVGVGVGVTEPPGVTWIPDTVA